MMLEMKNLLLLPPFLQVQAMLGKKNLSIPSATLRGIDDAKKEKPASAIGYPGPSGLR